MKAGRPMKKGWNQIKMMNSMIRNTAEQEIVCGECFDQMDAFVEQYLDGKENSQKIHLVQDHLDKCGDCREEFELLLKALKSLS